MCSQRSTQWTGLWSTWHIFSSTTSQVWIHHQYTDQPFIFPKILYFLSKDVDDIEKLSWSRAFRKIPPASHFGLQKVQMAEAQHSLTSLYIHPVVMTAVLPAGLHYSQPQIWCHSIKTVSICCVQFSSRLYQTCFYLLWKRSDICDLTRI